MQSDSFFQLNFVDLQIGGATKSLLSMLADAVLCSMVGATCMRAPSTVTQVLLQSDLKTVVGF